jgi:hypothetical protein
MIPVEERQRHPEKCERCGANAWKLDYSEKYLLEGECRRCGWRQELYSG